MKKLKYFICDFRCKNQYCDHRERKSERERVPPDKFNIPVIEAAHARGMSLPEVKVIQFGNISYLSSESCHLFLAPVQNTTCRPACQYMGRGKTAVCLSVYKSAIVTCEGKVTVSLRRSTSRTPPARCSFQLIISTVIQ